MVGVICFPMYRYASFPIDHWCFECYLMRHAPLNIKYKRITGQYDI